MIRYNTTIPSLSCTYKALISTTKSTMSIYLTSAPLGAFPPSSTKPTLFFSRASPQIISLLAPQAPRRRRRRNFVVCPPVNKIASNQFNLPHGVQCACLPDQRTYWSCLCFITALSHCPAYSSSTKIFIFRTCSSHSTLIWCLGTHILQLVGA